MPYFYSFCYSGIIGFLVLVAGCQANQHGIRLEPGLTISQSGIISNSAIILPVKDSLTPALEITGENLVIDFANCLIRGATDLTRPDRFTGVGIRVSGRNITIMNTRVHGYKIALQAEGVDSLRLIDCDFSHNFRQRLGSTREREDLNDWLYYHYNENDEWKRYGAAVYLRNCHHALLRGIRVTQGQNGLMLTGCDHALIYNNTICYSSGIGIGLYRSSHNRIMHNRLDFNVRGYSHGIYQRGQDSAGLLAYQQSSYNVFAYNSATHSGDGFFLWAGQHTMDTGEGGCNGNLIYENDFSYAPTNGIEVTFSSNYIAANTIRDCRYGIWGGYSYETLIQENAISGCQFGVAVEHGNNIRLIRNQFSDTQTGIRLWSREKQPEDWGYARARNVASRQYLIADNLFEKVPEPFDISGTDSVIQSGNYRDSKVLPDQVTEIPLYQEPDWPEPLPSGLDVKLKDHERQGREYIIVNEWGPYNFEYPLIWPSEVNGNTYVFSIYGPKGNWKLLRMTGFQNMSATSGSLPQSFTAERSDPDNEALIELEYSGTAFTDQFGQDYEQGTSYLFRYLAE